jgi:hypothetical protein
MGNVLGYIGAILFIILLCLGLIYLARRHRKKVKSEALMFHKETGERLPEIRF